MQMLTDDEKRDIDSRFVLIRLMWIALLIATVIYLIIANATETGVVQTEGEDSDWPFLLVSYILYSLGLILLVIAYYIRRAITSRKGFFSRIINLSLMSNYSTILAIGESTQPAIARYFSGIIFCLSLAEAIAIYGLIICIINGDFFSLYLLVGIAIMALIYFRPKKQELIDLAIQFKEDNQVQQISNIRGKIECPRCNRKITANDHYCSHCGQSLA